MGKRDFKDKVVVITGAAGGFGKALCRRFGAAGAKVVGLDLDILELEKLKVGLEESGIEARVYQCDVAVEMECIAAIKGVICEFGRVDLLINNAGVSHRSAFTNTDTAVIRRVMEINFFGAVHCTKAALESLIENRGMIITMSSIAGFAPLIARTGYSASKHALHGFYDSLRTELKDQDVKIMIVCPSFVKTGIDKSAMGGDGQPAKYPRKNAGAPSTPEEQADIILRAASMEKQLLLPSTMSKLSYWLHKALPKFYTNSMIKKLKSEMDDT